MKPRQFTDPEVEAFNKEYGVDYLTVCGPFHTPEEAEVAGSAYDEEVIVEHGGKYYYVTKR